MLNLASPAPVSFPPVETRHLKLEELPAECKRLVACEIGGSSGGWGWIWKHPREIYGRFDSLREAQDAIVRRGFSYAPNCILMIRK